MGFFDIITNRRSAALSDQVTHIQLTEMGEKKLRELEPTGRKFDVLAATKQLQPCSAKEISEKINWPENKVKYMLGELVREGWISKV